MTEQPTTPPEPAPDRPMPRLGRGSRWSAHLDEPIPPTEPYDPTTRTRRRPAGGWPKTGTVGASTRLNDDELPPTIPARPYTSPEVAEEEVPQVGHPPTPSLGEAGSSLGAAMHTCADHCQCDETRCSSCADSGHVCENHPDRPWAGMSDDINACDCGGAGMPCPDCCDPIPEDGSTTIGSAFVPRKFATGGLVMPPGSDASDVVPFLVTRCLYEQPLPVAPPAAELRAIADDLNSHGGLDETFVAELLRQAADPLADAKRGLGIVDPPVTKPEPTKPITYESIVEALEKIAPLGPQRLDVVKLTQEQIDVVTASQPHVAPSAEPWHYFGTPVELVETVEESTPYQLANAQPGGIISTDKTLTAEEFNRLRADWLRAMDAKTISLRRLTDTGSITRIVPFGEPFRPLAEVLDEQPPAPPRSWWRRALDRARRWGR